MKLQKTDRPTAKVIEPELEEFKIGQWYWIKDSEDIYDEEADEWTGEEREIDPWLGCITHVGSNHVELTGLRHSQSQSHQRILFDEFDDWCTPELEPDKLIARKVEEHRQNVNKLMGRIKQLTAGLGIAPRDELAAQSTESTQALVIAHGTKNIEEHKAALIKAKKETLPDLFKQVEDEHKVMSGWMKAQLIPMKAETAKLETSTEVIEQRIFTVELYAGLIEKMRLIKKGKPAGNDDKVHLFQRRHYMDEECLADYEAGGMDYKSVKGFDKWLCKKKNLNRILPHPRCIVAFQIRRKRKEREGFNLADFIHIGHEEDADKQTFLYIRNGKQVYRLTTGIDFGEQLFPDREQSTLLGDSRLWMEVHMGCDKVITQREYDAIQAERNERIARWENEIAAWEKQQAKKKKPDNHCFAPHKPHEWDEWVPCTPDHVYYDDAMRMVARAAIDHNRVAVVLQGILDRSPSLHPHPPWQLWTAEGFSSAIELVYDSTRVLTDGDAPDFEAYRAKLNATLKKGSHTVGQEDLWESIEADKEYKRQRADWRVKNPFHWKRFTPYGNPGPGKIAQPVKVSRNGRCTYEWKRSRKKDRWISDPDKPGYEKLDDAGITTRFTCGSSKVLNVDAYTPGDFKIFYADHRTRQDYLKWAPLLLAAEDYVGRKKQKEKK